MDSQKSKYKLYLLFLPIVLVALDQITKYMVRKDLSGGKVITLIPKTLCFQYVENRGAAWGLFQGKYDVLSAITVILLVGFIYLLIKMPANKKNIPMYVIFLFIVSGAIGNLIDRLVFSYVTDFIYFELIDFPVFNVADIYVTCSVILLVILVLFYYSEDELSYLPFFGSKKVEKKDESQN